MLYPEFNQYRNYPCSTSKLVNGYQGENEETFYVEPAFYTELLIYKQKRPEDFSRLLSEIDRLIKKNKKVVFTGDYEHPFVDLPDFIYLEVEDIANAIGIVVPDDNRPSDYGD